MFRESDSSNACAEWSDNERDAEGSHRQADEKGGPVSVAIRAEGATVPLEVRDHGPGLPPGDEEKVFEPFFTTRVRGTGLGLPMARRVAEQHGGTLRGRNHPEGGAVFTLVLPDAARPAAPHV